MIKNSDKSEKSEKKVQPEAEDAVDTQAVSEDTAEEASQETAEEIVEETVEETVSKKDFDELNNKYLRLLAEYDNFKKRTVKEKESIYIDSVGDTVMELLPVVDNFERAMASFKDEDKETDLYKGIEMIYKQTLEAFSKLGVAPIEAVGCEFDPEKHNAIMHIDDESIADNTVIEEFQKGYTYRDKVIRYSMVKVAN